MEACQNLWDMHVKKWDTFMKLSSLRCSFIVEDIFQKYKYIIEHNYLNMKHPISDYEGFRASQEYHLVIGAVTRWLGRRAQHPSSPQKHFSS